MTDEIKETSKRINVRIPADLYSRVVQSYGITEAVVQGLELLMNEPDTNTKEYSSSLNPELVMNLKDRIGSLEEQLKAKDVSYQERIESLEDQLHKKDEQLHMQGVHLQTLITQKAIEAPGAKKPWWQFW